MFECFRSRKLESKREKAEAACELGRTLLEMGEDRDMTVETVGHEIQHALADNGPGYLGLNNNIFIYEAYYEPDGERTPEEMRRMAEAVGKEKMSPIDKQVRRKYK